MEIISQKRGDKSRGLKNLIKKRRPEEVEQSTSAPLEGDGIKR
jgi:hypothetical protein